MADNETAAAPVAAPAAAPALTPDPAKSYRLTLARAIQVAPDIWARPGSHETIVKGSLIAGFGDAVIKYEEV
jgi:hypothetical protein